MGKSLDSSKSYVTLDKEMSIYTYFVLRLEEKRSLSVSDKTSFTRKDIEVIYIKSRVIQIYYTSFFCVCEYIKISPVLGF